MSMKKSMKFIMKNTNMPKLVPILFSDHTHKDVAIYDAIFL